MLKPIEYPLLSPVYNVSLITRHEHHCNLFCNNLSPPESRGCSKTEIPTYIAIESHLLYTYVSRGPTVLKFSLALGAQGCQRVLTNCVTGIWILWKHILLRDMSYKRDGCKVDFLHVNDPVVCLLDIYYWHSVNTLKLTQNGHRQHFICIIL